MEAIKSAFLFITLSILFCCIEANSFGFSTNLIHRDSIFSPYFNSSKTYYENLRNSVLRAKERSAYIFSRKFDSSPITIQLPLTTVPQEYLMTISVGTPPLDLLVVADTGSDLIWTQCQPCDSCYVQAAPFFDPRKSSTYQNQSCKSDLCQILSATSCQADHNCNYYIIYGDESYSRGDFSLESFTFRSTSGSPVILPNIAFGCGYSNGGTFDKYTTGIVGLGNGKLSLVNQANGTINGKFSYCLAPITAHVTSRISFGSNAVVSGDGVQTTAFYTKEVDTFYYLGLETISVGDEKVQFMTNTNTNDVGESGGNIIIDTGTTYTFLPSKVYPLFEKMYNVSISLTPVEGQGEFERCYKQEAGFEQKAPIVTFHFTGADLVLDATTTLLEVAEGVVCLAILSTDDKVGAILGNVQQQNYLVGYDLVSKTVSFKKSDCTNL